MQIIIAITLLITAYWTGMNVGPQLKDGEAVPAALRSMLTIIALFIIALLVLKSPWCSCLFIEY